jgi:hypothetical protein
MTGGTLDLQLLAWTFCGGSWMEDILKLQRFVQPVLFCSEMGGVLDYFELKAGHGVCVIFPFI